MIKFILMVFCINITLIYSEEIKIEGNQDYWTCLKKRAEELYCGLDMEFDISAAIAKQTDDETEGEIKLSIPLYSSSEKRAKKEEKRDYLNKGAELIREIEINQKMIEFLRDQEKIKKATMYEDGAKGTEAYFRIVQEIVEKEAGIREAERKLESLLM